MLKGHFLDTVEQGKILALCEVGLLIGFISEALKCSKSTIWRFLDNPESYRANNYKGSKKKLLEHQQQQILRLASQGVSSVIEIKMVFNLEISQSSIYTVLEIAAYLKYTKQMPLPVLNAKHRHAQEEFAKCT